MNITTACITSSKQKDARRNYSVVRFDCCLLSFTRLTQCHRFSEFNSVAENHQVEAAADAWGLKVGVVHTCTDSICNMRLWGCGNGSTLTVTSINGGDIQASGCDYIGEDNISLDQGTMQGVLDWVGVAADVGGAVAGAGSSTAALRASTPATTRVSKSHGNGPVCRASVEHVTKQLLEDLVEEGVLFDDEKKAVHHVVEKLLEDLVDDNGMN